MSESLRTLSKSAHARAALSLAVGLAIGVAVESHTDDVAREKIVTVETCKKMTPVEDNVTTAFHDCIVKGVPGGTKIGPNAIPVGEPAAYVDAYLASEHNELGLEFGRLALWSLGGAFFEVADFVL